MNRLLRTTLFIMSFFFCLQAIGATTPKNGFVPDAETAIWIVEGSLPPTMIGGAPGVKISKKTGEILSLFCGQ
jgi:hypothetical protein